MCWRCDTREGREESERQSQQIAKGWTLVTEGAFKGASAHIDQQPRSTREGRRYFRLDYFSTLAGPMHTTELRFEPGTVVVVTKMPESVRSEFKLRARDLAEDQWNHRKDKVGGPRAKIVLIEGKIGLSFGKTGKKVFYPLEGEKDVFLRVISVPRSSEDRT